MLPVRVRDLDIIRNPPCLHSANFWGHQGSTIGNIYSFMLIILLGATYYLTDVLWEDWVVPGFRPHLPPNQTAVPRDTCKTCSFLQYTNPFLFIKNKQLFISSEGFSALATHPVGCDNPLQIVMAVWRFCFKI
jgi:hypothetical protein